MAKLMSNQIFYFIDKYSLTLTKEGETWIDYGIIHDNSEVTGIIDGSAAANTRLKIGDKIQLDDKENENDSEHDVHEEIRKLLDEEATSITLNLIGIKDHEARAKLENPMKCNLFIKFYNQIHI